jgi:uncharacterized protein YgiM (DUF1202 family)
MAITGALVVTAAAASYAAYDTHQARVDAKKQRNKALGQEREAQAQRQRDASRAIAAKRKRAVAGSQSKNAPPNVAAGALGAPGVPATAGKTLLGS